MTNTCLPKPLVVCGLIWLGPDSVLSFGPCGDVVMEGGVILPYCFQVSIAAQVQVLFFQGARLDVLPWSLTHSLRSGGLGFLGPLLRGRVVGVGGSGLCQVLGDSWLLG